MLVDIEIDAEELEKVSAGLNLLPGAVDRAARRAVSRTATWARSQAARAASRELEVGYTKIRNRIRIYRQSDGSVKIWAGSRPLPAWAFGKPVQRQKGVRAGKKFFRGAFVIKKYAKPGKAHAYYRVGRERFPIRKARVDIADEMSAIMNTVQSNVFSKLKERLSHELDYELSKVKM